MNNLRLVLIALMSFAGSFANAEIKPGDLVLIEGTNRGVSVYRPAYVLLAQNESSVVQELNYSSRYGSVNWTYNSKGEVVKTYGVYSVSNSKLIETAPTVHRNGVELKAGDLFKIKLSPRSWKTRDANILATFKNGKLLIMTAEDYSEYSKDGDRIFVKGPVALYLR